MDYDPPKKQTDTAAAIVDQPTKEKTEQEKLLSEIKVSITTQARSSTFACGGHVPFKDPPGGEFGTIYISKPLQIRFGDHGHGKILTLPLDSPESSQPFGDFIAACEPASFARAGKEVIDENYRKAGKLDIGEFLTSFCPYRAGIIGVVEQLSARGIKAELYKLNVYSAPSGKFKAHVDTPRGTSQFGSLVVSLPVTHEGGQLVVRHAGKEVTIDWSTSKSKGKALTGIDWAAFYSDCEHEVREVTSGNRVTLTYNLYFTRGAGELAGEPRALDAKTLPLFKTLSTALKNPQFLKNGHVLAIWLTHSYAHTSNCNLLPASLKGADMALYKSAWALRLDVKVVPVIPKAAYSMRDDDGEVKSLRDEDEYNDEGEYDYESDYVDTPVDLMSSHFHEFNRGKSSNANLGEEDGSGWGVGMPPGKYTWVNPSDPALREIQMAYMVYGNDLGSMIVRYSRAAMLIRIPPYQERGRWGNPYQSIFARIPDEKVDYPDYSVQNDSTEEGMRGLF